MYLFNSHIINQEKLLFESIEEMKDTSSDFTTKYFAVGYLQSIAETDPEIITKDAVDTLASLLQNRKYAQERRGFFLFRLTAETLKSIIIHSNGSSTGERAFTELIKTLSKTSGHAHRAAAEALGSLPHGISNRQSQDPKFDNIPPLEWPALLKKTGFKVPTLINFFGRSLVFRLKSNNGIMVLKFARKHDTPEGLIQEASWMEKIRTLKKSFPFRFNIPKPLKIQGTYIFRLKDCPIEVSKKRDLHSEKYFICFFAHREYYIYPNHHDKMDSLSHRGFLEVLTRNAQIMGRLASMGIIHTAPIPLFHNRIEGHRRRDLGLYEWFRGGRLDRWLESCKYPNIGYTGIRDFEHFITFNGPNKQLYRYIGTHFLSLLLICGSYFRNKDTKKVGLDKDGRPYDTRELFDRNLLKEIVRRIFEDYYSGFTGQNFNNDLPLDLDKLTFRMIEEMGVDNHMNEVLRIVDQQEMSKDMFIEFLLKRGFSQEDVRRFDKGAADIVINSGPHLGGFNDKISLPELIDAVECMSALCMSGRYLRINKFAKTKRENVN
jgi:hypothetical protein